MCAKCQTTRWRAANARKAIFQKKKSSAIARSIPFTVRFQDIAWPETCPALGTRLDYLAGGRLGCHRDPRRVPSFDRVDPSRGYEPGNVQVISMAANSIKSQYVATEIRAVADWLERLTGASSQ